MHGLLGGLGRWLGRVIDAAPARESLSIGVLTHAQRDASLTSTI